MPNNVIVQIYEIQDPVEAEAVVALGVDHVGSVILSARDWKTPVIRETIRVARQGGARSGLIPLFGDLPTVCAALDYYQPDFVHFCEVLPPFPGNGVPGEKDLEVLLDLQAAVKGRFPRLEIMRSLSVPEPMADPDAAILENILHFVEVLGPLSDYFLIDTIKGRGNTPGTQPSRRIRGYHGRCL